MEITLFNFGSTSSGGNSRAPLNRLKILKLLRREELREADLVERAGLTKQSIRSHLKALEKIGFIAYDAVPESNKTKGTFKYQYSGKQGEPEPYGFCAKLTKDVLKVMKDAEDADRYEVADVLGYKHISNVSCVLSYLEKQGFLERVGKFRMEVKSNARINDKGKRFIEEFYDVWEEALSDGTILNELQRKSEEFFDNRAREYLTRGIGNHWRVSPRAKAKPREVTNKRIIAYLKKNPGARPKDIERDLGLTYFTKYLTSLVKLGRLKKKRIDEQNKGAIGYFAL